MDLAARRDILKRIPTKSKMAFIILMLFTILMGVFLPFFVSFEALSTVKTDKVYLPGELSDEDVLSPVSFTYVDEVETEQRRAIARKNILPYFDFSLSQTSLIESNSRELINIISDQKLFNEYKEKYKFFSLYEDLEEREKKQTLILILDSVRYLLNKGIFSSSEINSAISSGYESVSAYIPINLNYDSKEVTLSINNIITENNYYPEFLKFLSNYRIDLSPGAIDFLFTTITYLIKPNVFYDSFYTDNLREEAANSVETVTYQINEGDYIIKKDTIVTEHALRTIERINSSNVKINYIELIGRFILLLILTLVAVGYYFVNIRREYRILQYSSIFLISFIFTLLATYLVYRYLNIIYLPQAVPFLLMPLLLTHITDKRRFGFVSGILLSCYLSLLRGSTVITFFYYIFVIEVALLFVKFGVTRLEMIYQAFYTSIATMFITVIFSFLSNNIYFHLLAELVFISLNVCFSYIILAILLPLLEHFMNIPTVFRLHELSLKNSPALNKLRTQAKGTYNHSNNVAEMAYHAARDIGLNAELARAAGLYHDIGKGDHPEYFIENQSAGQNIHDSLKYTLSAAVIKSHVKLGVEKGKEAGLPQEILDIIEQHHGTDLMQHFYYSALNDADDNTNVSQEDFRYNYDIPKTPEAAVVMLADCFEAASRTIKDPKTHKYEKCIDDIISKKIANKQLLDSNLTLTDLAKIRQAFILDVFGRDHQRIEYNKEEN